MSIYSNFFKNPFHSLFILKSGPTRFVSPILASTAAAPPLIKVAPPDNNIWEFTTIPSEKPSDPGPVSPGPNPGPEFPRPPSPSPPTPEGPRPPLPSPGGPFPPHGPDVIPPKPPEPDPPSPIKPDVPPPVMVMGSDGLVFY